MENKVSVILPSLNVADYIEEAVKSAMNQTLKEIEIICIDAGSDDGTWEILSRLAKTDERIILCHSDKRSYGYQVNMGIDMARGEYIAILETDDYIAAEMYEHLYDAAVKYACDYVKSDRFVYWTPKNGERFFLKKNTFGNKDSYLYDKIIEPKRYPVIASEDWYLWNGIYKKEYLIKNNIRLAETPGAAFQDIGFVFQTNVYAKKALYIRGAYYNYCIDRASSSSNVGKALKYSYTEFVRLCELLERRNVTDADILRSLYCRMTKSFVCCYIDISKGFIKGTDEERAGYYRWFRGKLQGAIEKNIVNSSVIQDDLWNKLNELLISEESYIEKVMAHEEENKEKVRDKIGRPGEHPVVIFGCGSYGHIVYEWLGQEDYTIVSFMDNDKALWGMKIGGIAIISPQDGKNIPDGAKYVIANELHYAEIERQLLDMGVKEENICIYS